MVRTLGVQVGHISFADTSTALKASFGQDRPILRRTANVPRSRNRLMLPQKKSFPDPFTATGEIA